MPYIKQVLRSYIDRNETRPGTSGELNYKLTKTIIDYLLLQGLSYKTINDINGALEGCKMEFYRRIVVPYEDKKIKENGDVYHEIQNL